VEEEKSSILNLLTAGTSDAITMVEAAAKEVSDKQMLDALAKSHKIIKKIIEAEKDYLALYKDKY
jgi:polyribonucleotide nucleotidyltransferase